MKVAILVCTRQRPKGLLNLIGSINALAIPPHVDTTICVADNNDAPQVAGYIEEARRLSDLPLITAHEPVKGYASARNTALDLGLSTNADILAFCDDDDTLDAEWLAAHIDALQRHEADVVCGPLRVVHVKTRAEGEVVANVAKGVGTCNLSFRRHVVAAEGAGIRFDLAFNLSGGEDTRFLQDCQKAALRIVWSNRPLIRRGEPDWDKEPEAAYLYFMRFADLRRRKQRNRMAAARANKDWLAMGTLIAQALVQGVKGCLVSPIGQLVCPISRPTGLRLLLVSRRAFFRFSGTVEGFLHGPEARQG